MNLSASQFQPPPHLGVDSDSSSTPTTTTKPLPKQDEPVSSSSASSSSCCRDLTESIKTTLDWGMVVDVPIGAPADVKELEYCSALRQTRKDLRSNGSLIARDIQIHLLSRHSIDVPLDQIEQSILVELAGGTSYQVSMESGLTAGKPHHKKNSSSLGTNSSGSSLHPMLHDNKIIMQQSISSLGMEDLFESDDIMAMPPSPKAARQELERQMVVLKTTPLDMVQQTALLLIPELQRIRVKTAGGLLPPAATLMPPEVISDAADTTDSEEQAPPDPSSIAASDNPKACDIKVMIEASLLLVCEEAGIEYGVELTVDVMRDILHAFSEDHWDDDTVEQMVKAASSSSGNEVPALDSDTFLQALTSDLSRYRTEWIDQSSTILQDVNSNERVSDVGLPPPAMTTFYSFPSIDYTADVYSNYIWAILSWFLFMITFGSYIYDKFNNQLGKDIDCDASILTPFGCRVLQSAIVWLEIFAKLMIIGLAFIYLITLGNAEFTNRCLGVTATVSSMVFIVIVSALAFRYEVDTFLFSTSKVETEESVYYVSFVTGVILLILQVVQIMRTIFPQGLHSRVAELLAPSPVLYEKRSKHAAQFKVQRLIRHALSCHFKAKNDKAFAPHKRTNCRRLNAIQMHGRTATALHKFYDQSLETKSIGSVWWILNTYWRGNRLAWREGLWISPRLLWSNLAQWFVICTTLVVHMFCVRAVRGLPDPITDGLTPAGVLTCLNVGVAAGVAAQAAVAANYVPSAISQTFMFRGGVLGTLHSRKFNDSRSSHDSVGYLFGSALWGAQLMGLIVWAFVASTMLFFVWGFTQRWAIAAVVQLCAFALTITVKNVVLLLLRRNWYAAFYRTKPGAANIMSVILESLFLSLSTGYIISRAITFIALSLLYIARIDSPFLADGVGGFGVDKFPMAFRTDILLHEAHRHPYMERWSFLYLMKLRHGSKFGTRAGAAWRILLVMALMPWMRKYRVYPAVNGVGRLDGSNDSGVLPPFEGEAPYTESEELRQEKERRMMLEEEIKALKLQVEKLGGASHHSLYSC